MPIDKRDPSEAAAHKEALRSASVSSPRKNNGSENKENDLDSVAAGTPPPTLALARAAASTAAAAAANDKKEVPSFAAPCENNIRDGSVSFGVTTLVFQQPPPNSHLASSAPVSASSALPRRNANAAAAMPQISENSVWQPQGKQQGSGSAKENKKNKNKNMRSSSDDDDDDDDDNAAASKAAALAFEEDSLFEGGEDDEGSDDEESASRRKKKKQKRAVALPVEVVVVAVEEVKQPQQRPAPLPVAPAPAPARRYSWPSRAAAMPLLKKNNKIDASGNDGDDEASPEQGAQQQQQQALALSRSLAPRWPADLRIGNAQQLVSAEKSPYVLMRDIVPLSREQARRLLLASVEPGHPLDVEE